MERGGEIPPIPARPDEADRPRIGVDQWVADVEGRREERSPLRRAFEATPPAARVAVLLAAASALPFLLSAGNLFRYGLFTLLFALLALGLNVTVGFAGLLDLGYIAFYGFGAYGYAMLASDHFGVHWRTQWVIPVVVAATVLVGFLVGLPSRRLLGDYLAIVTLFFLQLFLTILLNADRLNVPFHEGEVNFTRGRTSTRCACSAGGWSRSTSISTSRSARSRSSSSGSRS